MFRNCASRLEPLQSRLQSLRSTALAAGSEPTPSPLCSLGHLTGAQGPCPRCPLQGLAQRMRRAKSSC